MGRRIWLGAIAAAVLVLTAGGLLWIRAVSRRPVNPAATTAQYAGSDRCAGCHAPEAARWQTSQHRQAMMPADGQSVRGDFSGTSFSGSGSTATFFTRDGGYWVRTEGEDGRLTDFPITYTFGVFPLQQYLIERPGGRLQALSIAWDSRAREAGGQRWFHLYPDERIDHTDELHWTGRQQNWNFMCADCHSTNVHKGYDAAGDRFATTWSELSVGCEACHGPGSDHIRWAGASAWTRRLFWPTNGLTVSLTERRGVSWSPDPASFRPVRSTPRVSSTEMETCARCHARRLQIAEGFVPGAALEDYYVTSTLDAPLYFPDGQQRDEVYVYGSFLQSRMHHAGVTCADCHDPHDGKPRAEGNVLCGTCHPAATFDTTAHHGHRPGTPAALCVSCHMPSRTYMVVDPRRDHSFRVPRPDLTATTGAPNACNACHTSQTSAWAADALLARTGRPPTGFQQFAEAFHASDEHQPGAPAALAAVASASNTPSLVRASVLARLASLPGTVAADAARQHLDDANPLVRRAAVRVLDMLPPADRPVLVLSKLSDTSRSVRIEAARLLAPAAAPLVGVDRQRFDAAAAELVAAERLHADRPEHRTALGTFFADLGRRAEAIDELRAALRLNAAFVPAAVNLADVYRQQQDDASAEQVLTMALSRTPASADLHYALGLLFARTSRGADAATSLRRAMELAPQVPRFVYAYALALNGGGRQADAIAVLAAGVARHPQDRDLLFALATIERDAGRRADALRHAEMLSALAPEDPGARQLVASLR